jgi:hypothetical protein
MRPYETVKEGSYYYCVDKRSGAKVSYPEPTRWNADQHTATMNSAYAEAIKGDK